MPAEPQNHPAGICLRETDGWRIQWKADGTDYPAILNDFRQGSLPADRLSTGSPDREVWRAALSDRRLVIKKDLEFDPRPEKKLWDRLGGTQYSRLIKFTNRAVNQGCRLIQDVYLVAEKLVDGRCREAWLIAEYVEGQAFIQAFDENGRPSKFIDHQPWIGEMTRAMAELHGWGLATNDFHPGNFVITDQGLRIIDLAMDGPMIICQANDALTMMHFFQVRPPLKSPALKLVYALMALWRRQKNFTRKLRRKIKHILGGSHHES